MKKQADLDAKLEKKRRREAALKRRQDREEAAAAGEAEPPAAPVEGQEGSAITRIWKSVFQFVIIHNKMYYYLLFFKFYY